jgi:dolichyl-phosphate-mannose--protein O-mannosyl transferase
MFRLCIGVVLVLALSSFVDGKKVEYVTCGSLITLKGFKQDTTLACKEAVYGAHGSGQHACTGMGKETAESDRYFIVRGIEGEDCLQGTIIPKGMKIRFQHMASGRWLHSHRFRSMMSNNQEVSCFGGPGESDDSDVWKVTWTGGSKHWESKDKVYLQHDVTQVYLAAAGQEYPQPLQGQKEIVGFKSKTADTIFTVAEGVYFPQRSSSGSGPKSSDHEEL